MLFEWKAMFKGCPVESDDLVFPAKATQFFSKVPYTQCCLDVGVKVGLERLHFFVCHAAEFQCLVPIRRIGLMIKTQCNL